MPWLSRVNWSATDNRPNWNDLNSWGLDIRTWGGNVDGGGNSLVNVNNVFATRVGVGTSSPVGVLHVVSEARNFDETGHAIIAGSAVDPLSRIHFGFDRVSAFGYLQSLRVGVGGRSFLINPYGGNVGIGTTAATSRLTVGGLPSSPAGLGSGAFWYDPADGNRVKYVP